MTDGLRPEGTAELDRCLARYVDRREVPGLVALVARGEDVHVTVLGTPALDDARPLRRDALFRIASLSKPIGGAAVMALVDDGALSLGDPVETYLPELADRRVLRSLESALDDTVPAARSVTVEDVLTFRLGFGSIMSPPGTYPIQEAEAALELMTLGPPWPPSALTSDEWIARFATLPLLEQPGTAWRYNTGAQVAGVLVERVSGQPLEDFLRARILGPLGMRDTSFSVPAHALDRFTTAYAPDESDELRVLDRPDGWWSRPPAMANVAGMLVSTLDDFWAFVAMLAAGGRHEGRRILSADAVAAMTRNHLNDAQRTANTLFLGEHGGWGYCMAAPVPVAAVPLTLHGYGWDGGTGTTWRTDPGRGLTGILFTQRAMTSPEPHPVFRDFWRAAVVAAAD
jgi:CubicO group peptidase (beta-lactamase class C family)